MLRILKKIYIFSGNKKHLIKKSLIVSFINGLFSALQFVAIFITLNAVIIDNKSKSTLWISFGIMLISIVGKAITGYYSNIQQTEAGYCMVAEKRIQIGDRLRYIPMGYFNKTSVGNISAMVTTTLGDVENSATRVLVSVIGGLFNVITMTIFLFVFDYKIGFIALLGLLIYLAMNEISQKKSTCHSSQRQEAQEGLVKSILEYVQGLSIVKSFGLEKDSSQSINHAIDESCKKNLKLTYNSIPYTGIQQIVIRLFSIAIIITSIIFYMNDVFNLTYCVLMIIASFLIFGELETVGNMSSLLQLLSVSMDTANTIEQTPVMNIDGADVNAKNKDILIKEVYFSYKNKKILDGVSLTIPEKTSLAIVGPSGSGKTTLCNLIARFWDVDKGEIQIGGNNIKEYTFDNLMNHISMVFQNVYLFQDTIENNIKFGNPTATHEQVATIAKAACCHDFIMDLPNGYDTVVGEGGGTLSGGEKQRISIARAMLKDAPIIMLDEATSNIDPENEAELQSAIEALTNNKTVIMIAHRLKTVRNVDNIVVIDQGQIISQGTHYELLEKCKLYSEFINTKEKTISWKI